MFQNTLVAQIRKLSITLICLIGTTLSSLTATADDTEIFFSDARGNTLSKSNILFVLDNSGSMGYDYNDVWAWGNDYSTSTIEPNRMDDMQDAMIALLDDVKNVNIGIMTFTYDDCPTRPAIPGCNGRDNYARLVHPVADIDLGGNRATLKNSVRGLLPRTNTPITASLYEAAMVMTGGPASRLGGRYDSPILSECQQNHIVILSDGIANSNVPEAEIEALPGLGAGACGVGDANGTHCGLELAGWLSDTDHFPGGKKNPITVHTIGFAIKSQFLENLATAGGGGYRAPENAPELSAVFNEILKEVKDVDTTFVAPITSTDKLNRLGQNDNLYFGMFTPSLKAQWDGNLKRYKLGLDSVGNVVVKDANDQNAISAATGYFDDRARSFWSNGVDGADVTKGGAASKISHVNRKLYTYVGADIRPATNRGPIDLVRTTNRATLLDRSNPSLTPALFGAAGTNEKNDLIDWARGVDTKDEYDDATDPTDSRKHIGDILHSTPISVNYDHRNGPLIFFGTNEGFLHAIDSYDGTEEYAFIPEELLGNLKLFNENSRDIPHPYGLDGSITFHHVDNADARDTDDDGNDIVDRGEIAMLYFGMRRGGRSYYALDVSSRDKPKLSWHIQGGTPGDFVDLGQTWSKPTTARIRYKGAVRHVLIFGGGYDENQDPTNPNNLTQTQSRDSMGNAVYIVDAATGSLLWKADRNSHSDMDYSIPSDVNVLDIDSDGLADRLYVGDMGGQLWRFDINSGHKPTDNANSLVYGGVMAELGGNNTVANARRFYNKPDVSLISAEGEQFMSVSIGSGWRAHPRNTTVNDRFYMIRDNRPLTRITDSNDFGAVQIGGATPSWRPASESDLRDVTTSIDNNSAPDYDGWMLRLEPTDGEKSLSHSVTINNQIIFSSYAPEEHTDDCLPAGDSNFIYAVDVLRGNPVLPLAGGGTSSIADRKEQLNIDGIAPPPSAVIKQNDAGGYSTGVLVGTKPVLQALDFSGLTKRTYWHDRRRGNQTPGSIGEQACSSVEESGGTEVLDLTGSATGGASAGGAC